MSGERYEYELGRIADALERIANALEPKEDDEGPEGIRSHLSSIASALGDLEDRGIEIFAPKGISVTTDSE